MTVVSTVSQWPQQQSLAMAEADIIETTTNEAKILVTSVSFAVWPARSVRVFVLISGITLIDCFRQTSFFLAE